MIGKQRLFDQDSLQNQNLIVMKVPQSPYQIVNWKKDSESESNSVINFSTNNNIHGKELNNLDDQNYLNLQIITSIATVTQSEDIKIYNS